MSFGLLLLAGAFIVPWPGHSEHRQNLYNPCRSSEFTRRWPAPVPPAVAAGRHGKVFYPAGQGSLKGMLRWITATDADGTKRTNGRGPTALAGLLPAAGSVRTIVAQERRFGQTRQKERAAAGRRYTDELLSRARSALYPLVSRLPVLVEGSLQSGLPAQAIQP